jgi:hypothetical protein
MKIYHLAYVLTLKTNLRSLQPPRDKRDISMQWNISPLINCHAIARWAKTNKQTQTCAVLFLFNYHGGVQPDK